MSSEPKRGKFSDYVEVRELKTYEVDARTMEDAVAAVRSLISSQDEVLDRRSKRGRKFGYEVRVAHVAMRDGWK